MKRYLWSRFLKMSLISAIIIISGCENWKPSDHGFLEGTISIGPLCPVERIPSDPGCLPTAETYRAYPVSIFDSGGKTKVIQLAPSLDGAFITELPTGSYKIVLEKEVNIGSSNLPAEISINAGDTTHFNVIIDTGIR